MIEIASLYLLSYAFSFYLFMKAEKRLHDEFKTPILNGDVMFILAISAIPIASPIVALVITAIDTCDATGNRWAARKNKFFND